MLLLAAAVPAAAPGAEIEVVVRNNVFDPPTVTIQAGDTVTWRKEGGYHNVVADDGSFDSGPAQSAPFVFSHTFGSPGVFRYHCLPHRAMGMRGTVIVQEAPPPAGCAPTAETLCLNRGRFASTVQWRTGEASGWATAMPLAGLPDSGLFYFFSPANVEMLVKVLDACVAPFDRFWVFAGFTTNVGFELTVTDTLTGERRVYRNPLGRIAPPVLDTDAFATCAAGSISGTGFRP